MSDLAKQYSKMVECATDLADFFLDQEGGAFALTVICDMLQVLLQAKELPAAVLVIKTICQVSESEFPLKTGKNLDSQNFNIEQLIEILSEILKQQ